MKSHKRVRYFSGQINLQPGRNDFIVNIVRLVSASLVMAGTVWSSPDEEEEKPQATSPSGELQFAISRNNSSHVLFRKTGRPHWKSLFSEENQLSVALPKVSSDDRLLVVEAGGASWGTYLTLLLRKRDGSYRELKEDLSKRAWSELEKNRAELKGASPLHQYCGVVGITTQPLAVIFRMAGDCWLKQGGGQQRFSPGFFRFRIEQKTIREIPQPEGWKDELPTAQ
ncbi:MAG: hypothetical protein ABIZ56_06190 [Chthoniobacteraceae bacterium]